jgi:hypothetical protein
VTPSAHESGGGSRHPRLGRSRARPCRTIWTRAASTPRCAGSCVRWPGRWPSRWRCG